METFNSPRIKETNPKNEKSHLFSKLNIRNETTAVDISEKASFMQKSVREILEDMKNFMNNSKGKEKEQKKLNQFKGRNNKKKGVKGNNNNFNIVLNKKIMQSINKTISGEGEFTKLILPRNPLRSSTEFINGMGETDRAVDSNFSSNKSLIKIQFNQGLKTENTSPKPRSPMKSSPKKREQLSYKDKQREKVMKRLGTSDTGFMSSLLMNTDKNFDIFKFMDINMYSILGGSKKVKYEERAEKKKKTQEFSFLEKLAKINEQAKKQESEDEEFSINSAIDNVNFRIESDIAIFKLLMERQDAKSGEKMTREINKSLNNNFSDIEKKFSHSTKIEKLKTNESLENFQLNSILESPERLDNTWLIEKNNKFSGISQSEKFHKYNKPVNLDIIEKRNNSIENEENKSFKRKLIFDKSLSSRLSSDSNRHIVRNLKSEFLLNNPTKTHYSTLTIKNNSLSNLNYEGKVLKFPKYQKNEKKLILSTENICPNRILNLNQKKKAIFSDHIGSHFVKYSPSLGPTENTTEIIQTTLNASQCVPLMSYGNSPENMFRTMSRFSPGSSLKNYLKNQSSPNARTVTENKKNFDSLNKMFRSHMFQSFDYVKTNLEDLRSTMKSDIKATKKQINKKIKKNNIVISKPGEFESLGKIYKLEEETLFKKKGRKKIYNLNSHPQQIMHDLMKESEKVNSVNINSSFKFKDIILKDNKKSNNFENNSKFSEYRNEFNINKFPKNNIRLHITENKYGNTYE